MENGRLEDRSMRNGAAIASAIGTALCLTETSFNVPRRLSYYRCPANLYYAGGEVAMESTQKQRTTLHAGRCHIENGRSTNTVYSNKHNDRAFSPENADHINSELVCQNLLYIVDEAGNITAKPENTTFADWEMQMYERYYRTWLDGQTERYKATGHASRARTMEQIISSPRYAPREEIISIGNLACKCQDEDAFIRVVDEYVRELQRRFPCVRILNYSIHRDEEARGEASNIHAHLRTCFVYQNQDGDFEPNQNKALESMNIQLPNPDAKLSRFNNRIITMTADCRTLLQEISMAQGFAIETEPESPGKKSLNKMEYKALALKKETAELSEQKAALESENAALASENTAIAEEIVAKQQERRQLDRDRKHIEKRIETLQQEESRLKGVLRHLRASIKSVEALFTKLATYIVRPGRSVLDDVLLDARTAGSREALCEAERI